MTKPHYQAPDQVPLPPTNAEVFTTCCDYCIVACGYKVYRWPENAAAGGNSASQNALGLDFPTQVMSGGWVSPNMHNVVTANGKRHNVIVIPDKDTGAVNVGGLHSVRGGCIAKKCYNPDTPTKDRLQYPQLRVNGKLQRVSWDTALDIFAELVDHTVTKYGEHAYAQKQFSYQFHENVYALTKFALRHINTPAFAWHDNPGNAPSVPGFRDVGFDPFGASYEDWYKADVMVISGTDPFETKTIIWNGWMMRGTQDHGQKQIFINPRRTNGPAYAEENGGLFLQVSPGTDTILHLALSRVILENGWQDAKWIKEYTSNKWESNEGFGQGTRNTPWQWRTTWGKLQTNGFEDFKKWILSQKESEVEYAAKKTGVPAAKIIAAAEMMAKPRADGSRPKTSIGIEKGNYWSNNYTNTASIASLGLLCGAGNRPGQMVSRLGGHQRGGTGGGSFPRNKSPEKFAGRRRKVLDVDKWVETGHVRLAYVVGTTWTTAMTASQALEKRIRELTTDSPHRPSRADTASAVSALKARMDAGGMVVVDQDIYLRDPIGKDIADLVLPAATWGEEDFARENGERRLRSYAKFYDAPGESKPDWWIVGQVAQRLGFEGFDWKNSNEVFEELARFNRGNRRNFQPLVMFAKRDGKTGHQALKELGTTGIQAPVRIENGKLVGTKRLHDSTYKHLETGPEGFTSDLKTVYSFNSHTGLANFIKAPWSLFSDFYEAIKPKGDELWVTNGRINEIWQTGFDDMMRRPYIVQRWPANFLEINPADAKKRGIESGDWVEASSDRVPVQVGGFIARTTREASYTGLVEAGNIKFVSAKVKLVAIVTDMVAPGVTYSLAHDGREEANALVPRVTDPMTTNYRFKLGVGKIKKVGESPYKNSFSQMSFASRTLS
jgi:arsenite oxidase large subunit